MVCSQHKTQRPHTSLNLSQPNIFEEIPQIRISDFSWCRLAAHGECGFAYSIHTEFNRVAVWRIRNLYFIRFACSDSDEFRYRYLIIGALLRS